LKVRERHAVQLEKRCRMIHIIRRTVRVHGDGGERGNIFPIGEVNKTWLPIGREGLV
jgi:hypothetical protein